MRVDRPVWLKTIISMLTAGTVALYLSGCSFIQPVTVKAPNDKQLQSVLTPPEVVSAEMMSVPEANLMGVSQGMKELIAKRIPLDERPERRLDRLFKVLRYDPDYAVQYDSDATYTAEEVYQHRRANCLAFSAMFIALAREAGLEAYFQEVELPPEWDALSDDTLVQYRHVNVKVKWLRGGEGVVDFRMDRYSDTYPQHVISDSQGLAQYYSNISMQHMVDNQLGKAYVAAYRAISADPSQSFIWSNMGIIQRRLGNLDEAEAAYRQALTLDSRDISASSNLAILYEVQGENARAEEMRRYSESIKRNNPYYRYALAQHAYRNGHYDEALNQITVALRKQSREHRFYYLRGLSLWNIGENQSAINNVKRAIRMAKEEEPAEQYEQQLEEWLASRG